MKRIILVATLALLGFQEMTNPFTGKLAVVGILAAGIGFRGAQYCGVTDNTYSQIRFYTDGIGDCDGYLDKTCYTGYSENTPKGTVETDKRKHTGALQQLNIQLAKYRTCRALGWIGVICIMPFITQPMIPFFRRMITSRT